jgi:single-strand DNA-binding protein
MFNKVILVGNLTRDIELRYLPSQSAVANFGIATNRKWKDKQSGEFREEVMFIDVALFGRPAEVAKQYLRRGSKVLVEGKLVFEQWVDNTGQKRSKHKIQADSVNFMDSKEQSGANGYNSNQAPTSPNNYESSPQAQYGQSPQSSSYGNSTYSNSGNSNYNSNQTSNNYNEYNTASKSTPPKEEKIPEIDIDDDDVPF